jgi:predicted dienelactone hydrolase
MATPSATPGATPTAAPNAFALGEIGQYHVGFQKVATVDASRGDRSVGITIWYPAVLSPGFTPGIPTVNAEPDRSGAPYPLILSSTTMARLLAPYLVSHGFAWASVDNIGPTMMSSEMVQQPRDILVALDEVASNPPTGLEGLVDAERAGAIGYSFDGYNAYVLGGARIDPAYYRAQCPTPDATTEALVANGMSAFDCLSDVRWKSFVTTAGPVATAGEDGLWQQMTDPRIRAVMPMAGEGWWLFGERGLAAFDRPALVIAATGDELYDENALLFERLGTPDRAFISFVGPRHVDMVQDKELVARLGHFAVAFFGHRLQGRDDLARFYSREFVGSHEDLAWGPVGGE